MRINFNKHYILIESQVCWYVKLTSICTEMTQCLKEESLNGQAFTSKRKVKTRGGQCSLNNSNYVCYLIIGLHPHTDWSKGSLFFLMISFPMDVSPTEKIHIQ